MFIMGQNPAVGSMHAGLQRRALSRLKWLVVRELAEIETSSFWKDSPEVRSGELRTEDIATEVFLMPAAGHVEKEGHSPTRSGCAVARQGPRSPGDARSELHFMYHLMRRVIDHYRDSEDPKDWPIRNLKWDYPVHGEEQEPEVEAVLKEINGYEVATGGP